MQTAVIGGAGFIGHNLVKVLRATGRDVVSIDQKGTESPVDGVSYREVDALVMPDLIDALEGSDSLVYTAGAADLEASAHEATITAQQNVLGIAIAIEAAHSLDLGTFGYLSSVYASGLVGGFYSASKRAAEDYLRVAADRWSLDTRIVRVGSVYGPSLSGKSLVNRIVRDALFQGEIRVSGDRSQRRSYIHVADVAEAIIRVLSDDTFRGLTVRLVGEEAITLDDLCLIASEAIGTPSPVITEPLSYSPHYVRLPDRPRDVPVTVSLPQFVDLGAGIAELVEYYRESGHANLSP